VNIWRTSSGNTGALVPVFVAIEELLQVSKLDVKSWKIIIIALCNILAKVMVWHGSVGHESDETSIGCRFVL